MCSSQLVKPHGDKFWDNNMYPTFGKATCTCFNVYKKLQARGRKLGSVPLPAFAAKAGAGLLVNR